MAASNAPKLLLRYVAAALQRKLQLAETQVRIDSAPFYSPFWQNYPMFQVVPGRGAGEGREAGQGGGNLRRRQYVTVWVYWRVLVDELGSDDQLLTQDGEGLMDLFEQARALFELTIFGDGVNDPLLVTPLRWEGESDPEVIDAENRIARRSLSMSGDYIVRQPSAVTLTLADVS